MRAEVKFHSKRHRASNRLTVLRTNLATTTAAYGAASPQAAKLSAEVAKQNKEFDSQRTKLLALRSALTTAGVNNLTAAEASMGQRIAKTTAAINQQTSALKAQGEQQRKMAALKDAHGKAMARTGVTAAAGVGMLTAGTRGVQMGMGPVADYATHQTHMLGIAKQIEGARDANTGKLGPIYYEMEKQIRDMSTVVPMPTTDIADMFTAGARMEVPKDELNGFVLMASDMASAFETAPAELAESMGKIGKNFKIPVASMRGMADAINFLDDNAISKGADIIDLMNRIGGIAGSVKISGADMAALGSTLLTLGENSETASTGIKTIFTRMAASTKMTAKFRGALKEIGLRPADVQASMAKDAVGTFTQLLEAIKKLPDKDRMGVMAEIAGIEHVGKMAKLVSNTEELRRQIALANSEDAKGSMAREAAARNETLAARWQMMSNRAFNLSAILGGVLEPVLTRLMGKVGPIIERFAAWAQKNQTLVQWVLGSAIAISALVAAAGALLISIAAVIAPILMVRFALRAIGIQGGMLSLVLRGLVAAAGFLKGALLGVARVLMANPIVAIIAAVAMAAYLIYEHWGGITSFFSNLWQTVKIGVNSAWKSITDALASAWHELLASAKSVWNELGGSFPAVLQTIAEAIINWSPVGLFYQAFAAVLRYFGFDLPARFSEFGANIIQGLVDGILGGVQWVRKAVGEAADAAIGWFKDKLGIHSPSRVFMEAGINVGEGAAAGIEGTQSMVRKSALAMAAAAAVSLPAAAVGLPAADAMTAAINTAPAMSAQPAMSAVSPTGGSVSITINAAPGMDPQAIAAAVRAELLRIEADKRARSAGGFYDLNH